MKRNFFKIPKFVKTNIHKKFQCLKTKLAQSCNFHAMKKFPINKFVGASLAGFGASYFSYAHQESLGPKILGVYIIESIFGTESRKRIVEESQKRSSPLKPNRLTLDISKQNPTSFLRKMIASKCFIILQSRLIFTTLFG
eukprot:TRINITY_DN434_c0_g1_i2.p1 TRINITY_DN434_c0_g1~~TRINITY_DN434_c0_g1_i2.p1  ORF type:complete len:151 (-),score=12.60 TRINITY_DN434_c0_g1_i2:439-858(-)